MLGVSLKLPMTLYFLNIFYFLIYWGFELLHIEKLYWAFCICKMSSQITAFSLLVKNMFANSMKWPVCLRMFLLYCLCSRNQLSALPACLCGLPLKVLIASNNKLGSLPEEIGQLKQLMELVCY